MDHFAELDVSVKETSVCIVDDSGKIVREVKVASRKRPPEPTPEAWAQIRHDYEHTDRPLAHICAEHDITIPMLRYRMKRWEWRRRKPLIPREGPPAVAMTQDARLASLPPTPYAGEAVTPRTRPPFAACFGGRPAPPGEGEEATSIVPRLQSAVARMLPAIEATIARLAEGPHRPRDMEQAGRALSSLIRALRELNALLASTLRRAEALR